MATVDGGEGEGAGEEEQWYMGEDGGELLVTTSQNTHYQVHACNANRTIIFNKKCFRAFKTTSSYPNYPLHFCLSSLEDVPPK